MSKRRDLIQVLLIIIIGMFIPFLVSIIVEFQLDITNLNHIFRIGSTYVWFLIIFGIELFFVFLYFHITYKIASKKLDKYKPK